MIQSYSDYTTKIKKYIYEFRLHVFLLQLYLKSA